ncbi:double stranded rna [Plasmopara halstedii]|uniref:RNA methyltransferase n=1 Tax=Plasmopara halstedii TaxID=4781 RepID=A0A0P1B6F2_PLAHL|nr:double stranded rna [Plasmopara halstedii]CEG49447.1 double stranded rna [Plasmopara halstedii]|eukprot:XP_024585816.1 double stranded rna [Plasmopara halstedii]
MASNATGHVLGNFHAYYSFNPVRERLRFMNTNIINALRRELLVNDPSMAKSEVTSTVLDVGCNEGDLTIALYDALNGRAEVYNSNQIDNVAEFDLRNISILNDRIQKEKKQVEYSILDMGDSCHRRRYVCELQIDSKLMGRGEGVSKKVAKAKAAGAALRLLLNSNDQKPEVQNGETSYHGIALPLTDEELATRKVLLVLGVDIDEDLINRAAKKNVQLTKGDTVHFCHVDIMTNKFCKTIAAFTALNQRSTAERKFNLVTCFSLTMWIHLNHGDEGLWKFLETISDMTEHLIIEPQTWKCYRNAQKRLIRMRVDVPHSFRKLNVRMDVIEQIDAFLLAPGRFRYKAHLGKTNWSRNVILYSRKLVMGMDYTS